MSTADLSNLPFSQDELTEVQRLVTYSGTSVEELLRFRRLVLCEASDRQRNWDAEKAGYTDPQMAVYAVADLIDPRVEHA